MLNTYFVPVYVDLTFLQNNPQMSTEELAAVRALLEELHQTNRQRQQSGESLLSTGTVHAYVFAANGRAIDSRHVAHAGPASVIEMLEQAIKALDVSAGEPIVAPHLQSPRPDCADDALVLHLTARYLVPRKSSEARQDMDGELVPLDASRLGGERSGQWSALPSEDWYVLERDQWMRLLPKQRVAVGDTWQIDGQLAETLLTRFYPTTELNDLSKNRIDEWSLKMTAVSVQADLVRAHITGRLKMKHAFYPGRDDDNFVNATIIGVLEFDVSEPRIERLQIVTEHANYGTADRSQPFGVALRIAP